MQPELQPIQAGTPVTTQDSALLAEHRVLRNTYWLLALSLIPTIIGAAIGTNIDVGFMRTSPMLSFFAILAIFYGWIYAIERNRNSSLGVGLLLGFTLFMGLLLGPLFQRILGFSNGVQLVMLAAGGTAAVFFTMAGIASTTKRDLSGLGNFLAVGAIVIMLAVVANVFFQSPVAQRDRRGLRAVLVAGDPVAGEQHRARRRDQLRLGDADAVRRRLQPVHEPAAVARHLRRQPRLIRIQRFKRRALRALFFRPARGQPRSNSAIDST